MKNKCREHRQMLNLHNWATTWNYDNDYVQVQLVKERQKETTRYVREIQQYKQSSQRQLTSAQTKHMLQFRLTYFSHHRTGSS